MDDTREAFLEKQINLYFDIINDIESSRGNRKKKEHLQTMKILYKEYKELLLAQQAR